MTKQHIITGQKYSRLTIITEAQSINGKRRVLCQCDCGEKKIVDYYKLKTEKVKSCGCFGREFASRPRFADLTGKVFDKLTVIHRDGDKKSVGSAIWLCKCSCGELVSIPARDLISQNTKSCGCLLSDFTKNLQTHNIEHHYKNGVFVPLLTQKVQSNSTTGHKGISVRNGKNGLKYIANITVHGKRHYLGIYNQLDEAITARKRAEEELFKPYLES